ncbi:DUF5777 family beta-barrel protein [Chitinophaga nivalis]|uniref:DUF5777 family beta-barrel protein n=1 Tax=Chitinophaga nivalis TaxID=2991709 RepID=A0ABT3ITY5_9BACT|nr:DUF5777 family beta-barrel protein [Chitinophaga nivalis]MCW3462874.1 DUF5777 family beta-barrel protein [Chitinophaga nivalis]MCW3487436.1 DUF5777 family beta-barrel protein [Chitinophaga nivalis]
MKRSFLLIYSIAMATYCQAQNDMSKLFDSTGTPRTYVKDTYKSTRIVMGQSTEMLRAHELDFRVTHRFGDAAGEFGGSKTFFGVDNAADIRIAFEYGITDNLMVGVSRSKGSGDLEQLYEGLVKYRLLQQSTDNSIPVSLAFFGNAVISGMTSAKEVTSASYFGSTTDRMSYVAQAIVSRKFGRRLSLTLLPTYIHRNRVAFNDMNNIFALGAAGRLKLSKRIGILAEYYYPFRSNASSDYAKSSRSTTYYQPLGIGLEIETGGHVFHVTFTNSTAILENQFISETTTSWLQGQFRWGFNISRRFTLFGKKDWKK